MIYPVGDGTREDFYSNWYIADGFGSYRVLGSYYHSGVDINLRTGGNTDLGEKLAAISNGRLVYYHKNSHPNRGFGIHHVYEIKGSFGVRWIHYAHCQEDGFMSSVQDIREGQVISKLGNSGTVWGHLHFTIFRVDPSTLPRGIDTVAKTPQQLDTYFEDPILFIENNWETNMPVDDCKKLLDKYDVNSVEELDQKIYDHVGTTWGGEVDGGYLGGDRKKVEQLSDELEECREDCLDKVTDLSYKITDLEKENLHLKDDLVKCNNNNGELKQAIIALEDEQNLNYRLWSELSGLPVVSQKGILRASDVIRGWLRDNPVKVSCWSIFIDNIKELFRR